MICGNHEGRVEDIWLIGVAVLLLAIVIGDVGAAPQRPAVLTRPDAPDTG